MCDSIMGIAEGISAQASANTDTQFTASITVIDLVTIYFALQQQFSKLLSTDAENIYIANCKVPGNPAGTAIVAEATQQRNTDSTTSDLETGNVDQIIQGQKGQSQIMGNAMTAIFSLEDPINELLKVMTDTLQQML
jgi:activator of HSP90 ATPase